MRRKTFDVLFETRAGMTDLVKQHCLWRSGFYYTLSIGLYSGVVFNTWLLHEPLEVRFAIVAAMIIICGTALSLYGFLLHGILETFGALAGDAKGLICLMGYTTLPFLVLTPCALLAGKLGFDGVLLLAGVTLIGCCWMLYLLVRSLEVVYIIDFYRAAATVLFSLLLLYIVVILPWQVGLHLLLRHF
ncbi:MAG: YIP1 family protein [Phascolarctobacterium sp.]|nr:YIP1 family protein [Phascolarctobacterium sp.]